MLPVWRSSLQTTPFSACSVLPAAFGSLGFSLLLVVAQPPRVIARPAASSRFRVRMGRILTHLPATGTRLAWSSRKGGHPMTPNDPRKDIDKEDETPSRHQREPMKAPGRE